MAIATKKGKEKYFIATQASVDSWGLCVFMYVLFMIDQFWKCLILSHFALIDKELLLASIFICQCQQKVRYEIWTGIDLCKIR